MTTSDDMMDGDEFQQQIQSLVTTADADGVTVEGSWFIPIDEGSTAGWDLEIVPLKRDDD